MCLMALTGLTSGVLRILGDMRFCRYRYTEWWLCFVIGISVALLFLSRVVHSII